MIRSTRTTSPALTATQIIPARVTSEVPGWSGVEPWGGRLGLEGVLITGCEPEFGPFDGLGTGLTATFLTPQSGAARPYRTDTPQTTPLRNLRLPSGAMGTRPVPCGLLSPGIGTLPWRTTGPHCGELRTLPRRTIGSALARQGAPRLTRPSTQNPPGDALCPSRWETILVTRLIPSAPLYPQRQAFRVAGHGNRIAPREPHRRTGTASHRGNPLAAREPPRTAESASDCPHDRARGWCGRRWAGTFGS